MSWITTTPRLRSLIENRRIYLNISQEGKSMSSFYGRRSS